MTLCPYINTVPCRGSKIGPPEYQSNVLPTELSWLDDWSCLILVTIYFRVRDIHVGLMQVFSGKTALVNIVLVVCLKMWSLLALGVWHGLVVSREACHSKDRGFTSRPFRLFSRPWDDSTTRQMIVFSIWKL